MYQRLQGQYDQQSDFRNLDARMKEEEKCRGVADRIFYLSIPPSIFTTVAACASQAASSKCALPGRVPGCHSGRRSVCFLDLSKHTAALRRIHLHMLL